MPYEAQSLECYTKHMQHKQAAIDHMVERNENRQPAYIHENIGSLHSIASAAYRDAWEAYNAGLPHKAEMHHATAEAHVRTAEDMRNWHGAHILKGP